MNSYLIVGANFQTRLNHIEVLIKPYQLSLKQFHPDLLIIEAKPSATINQIRQIQQFLSRKPYQAKIKVVIIPEAQKITLPAQNAFLKTLEEPPANSLIILCCQNQEQLIPTIISRCQIIALIAKSDIEIDRSLITHCSLLITQFLKAGIGERLKLIEPYEKTREEAIKFCEDMIIVLRENLLKNNLLISPRQLTTILKSLQKSLIYLKANVNIKLVLDNFVIALPNLTS